MATLDKMGPRLWPLISATVKVSHRNSFFIHPVPVNCCLSVVAGGLLKVRSEGAVGWPVLPAPGHGRQLLVTTHGTSTASRANHAIPSVAAWRASVGFKHVPFSFLGALIATVPGPGEALTPGVAMHRARRRESWTGRSKRAFPGGLRF